MKINTTLCILTLMASLSPIMAIDRADKKSAAQQNLAEIKIFQEFAKAFPRSVSNYIAMLKGVATFSSESAPMKDCAMSMANFAEESQKITTENQAQEFTNKLMHKMNQCSQVVANDFDKMAREHKNLPYVKVAQKFIEAHCDEVDRSIMMIKMEAMDPFTPAEEKKKLQELVQLLESLKSVKTEAQAERFMDDFFKLMRKNVVVQ